MRVSFAYPFSPFFLLLFLFLSFGLFLQESLGGKESVINRDLKFGWLKIGVPDLLDWLECCHVFDACKCVTRIVESFNDAWYSQGLEIFKAVALNLSFLINFFFFLILLVFEIFLNIL